MNTQTAALTPNQKAGVYAMTHILKTTATALSAQPESQLCGIAAREQIEEATRLVIASACSFVKEAEKPEDAACSIKLQANLTADLIKDALLDSQNAAYRSIPPLPLKGNGKRQKTASYTQAGTAAAINATQAAIIAFEQKPEDGASRAQTAASAIIAPATARAAAKAAKSKRPKDALNDYSEAVTTTIQAIMDNAERMATWMADTATETARTTISETRKTRNKQKKS